ncbi:unnamed protein product [Soboliphyme baturini]|uniref:GCV_T domain-containing protein n=1 Tax=Soboliphyme baturini TaxID=241478 RepID=A0A183IJU6_9BILA|nr:unnamed protein product [Soboliphyme baturini]
MEILYEDKYCKLVKGMIEVKCYYFPTFQSKWIKLCSVKRIFYERQKFRPFVIKGWGMSLSPIWWAKDLTRGFKQDKYNFVLQLENTLLDVGFTVVDGPRLIKAILPMLMRNTPIFDSILY